MRNAYLSLTYTIFSVFLNALDLSLIIPLINCMIFKKKKIQYAYSATSDNNILSFMNKPDKLYTALSLNLILK